MFKFLEKLPSDTAIAAAYFAIRVLTHRELYGRASKSRSENFLTEASKAEMDAVESIVKEIRVAERLEDLRKASDESVQHYIASLSAIARKRFFKDVKPSASAGKKLLRELRHTVNQK